MTLFFHELRRGRVSWAVWSIGISVILGICILIYPEMSVQMNKVGNIFADMGSFSQAFGMDKLNFGEFKGYFGIECGNMLGIGGALFAALLGVAALAKEEKEQTAEFLLTHPISRMRVFTQKLLAVAAQILALNLLTAAATVGTMLLIGESFPAAQLALLLTSFLLLQLEIAGITFGLSAFLRNGSLGISLGLCLLLYFMNLISNLVDTMEFLKYLTPFSYTDSAYIYEHSALNLSYLLSGLLLAVLSLTVGALHYRKKDI